MEANLTALLGALRPKIDSLAAERDVARAECERLQTVNDDLRRQLAEAERTISGLRTVNEFLILSHRLADTPEALADARRKVSNLIRRLDATIAMLRDDPAL